MGWLQVASQCSYNRPHVARHVMNDMRRFFVWWNQSIVAPVIVILAGCGGPRFHPVRGIVVFPDGKPLSGGWVTFEPLDSGVKTSAVGDIQPDGTFQLTTARNGDGAMAGRYRV